MCPRADRHTFAQVSEAEQGIPRFCALRSGPRNLTFRQSGPLWDCHRIDTGNPETIGRRGPGPPRTSGEGTALLPVFPGHVPAARAIVGRDGGAEGVDDFRDITDESVHAQPIGGCPVS
jgi:hypothetical protein